jgi:hypothetical protein
MSLVMIACAKGTDSGIIDDEGGADGGSEVVVIPGDTGRPDTAIPDGGGTDSPVDAPTPVGTHVVINEVQTAGASANDEFVELYNPTAATISLANWEVRYASDQGGAGGAGHKFGPASSIAPGAFILLSTSDGTWTTGMGGSDGQIAIFDATLPTVGTKIDGVAYGTVTSGANNYKEGQTAPSPPSGGSIGRSPSGVDTDANKTDFKVYTSPSPGSKNP